MNPPFQFGRAIADEFFTDRQQESERLLANFQNGINTILISPRRWGKTSLVKKVAKSAATNELKIIYIDIFQCREPEDFFQLFVETILKHAIPKWQQRLQAVGEFHTPRPQNNRQSRFYERIQHSPRPQERRKDTCRNPKSARSPRGKTQLQLCNLYR